MKTTHKEYTKEQLSSSLYLDDAKRLVSNWKQFESFGWSKAGDHDSKNMLVYNTKTRDSTLLTCSNHDAIIKSLQETKNMQFSREDDYHEERHGHWAVGYVDCVVVKVYRNFKTKKSVTPAFARLVDIINALSDYPILDESDYSEKELEETFKNTIDIATRWMRKNDFEIPSSLENEWEGELVHWLYENLPNEMENRDDNGGFPSEEAIEQAFVALSKQFKKECDNEKNNM